MTVLSISHINTTTTTPKDTVKSIFPSEKIRLFKMTQICLKDLSNSTMQGLPLRPALTARWYSYKGKIGDFRPQRFELQPKLRLEELSSALFFFPTSVSVTTLGCSQTRKTSRSSNSTRVWSLLIARQLSHVLSMMVVIIFRHAKDRCSFCSPVMCNCFSYDKGQYINQNQHNSIVINNNLQPQLVPFPHLLSVFNKKIKINKNTKRKTIFTVHGTNPRFYFF